MERTLITWTIPNLVTVWLMAAIGFLLIALVAQLIVRRTGSGGSKGGSILGGDASDASDGDLGATGY